jgi:hypothetical protein
MLDNITSYIDLLKKSVYGCISSAITLLTIEEIVRTDLVKSHLEDKISLGFQDYYFSTLDNESFYVNSTDFFRQFKKRYSLQCIDNNFLDRLEVQKAEILKKIRTDNLAQLYFDTFNKAEIKYGDGLKEKDLGSFFAKLVHTFRPFEYCA